MPLVEPIPQSASEASKGQASHAEAAGTHPPAGPSSQNTTVEATRPQHTPHSANSDVANGVADASADNDKAPETSEPGQVPSPPEPPFSQGSPPDASGSSQPSLPPAKDKPEEQDRAKPAAAPAAEDRASLTTSTHTHTRTQSTRRPDEPRKAKQSRRTKKAGLFARLFHVFVPCVGPSSARAHDIDLEKPKQPPLPIPVVAPVAPQEEKQPAKAPEPAPPQAPVEPQPPAPAPAEAVQVQDEPLPPEPSASAPLIQPEATPIPPPLQAIDIPPPSDDLAVIVPPTPTKSLLPPEETGGVLSGAVQPPGSTGDELLQEHPRQRDSDSDGSTSYTEDEDMDEGIPIDEVEDEEERLILNGGAGIPIGPDGVPRPLLPPLAPKHAGRKCLVLDLDETLVHSSFKSIQQADYVVPVEIEYHWHNVYVIKRPGVDNFLKKMGEIYEVVVFTASLSKYADPVLDKLDINHVVAHRLFRESCYNHRGNYVKDLSQLGRPISDTIIIDNSPASYIFHPNNAVPVSSWFNDPHDTELTDLVPFLADLGQVDDVRGVLDGGL